MGGDERDVGGEDARYEKRFLRNCVNDGSLMREHDGTIFLKKEEAFKIL